ncbi:NAD-glutamate dehydrogenase domain-containing protein, partial [Acinetobacter baumannii]
GAKGGFIAKKLPDPKDRAAFSAEVTRCYKDFITALLEITDNIVHQEIVPPENTKRYDGGDPYFVVAADKGTATFSDTANAISEKFSFWL